MSDAKRFEITLLEEISSGTFARVYLAEARGAGGISRIVAVKVLHQKWSESDEILARTRDEAHLLARLRHKNIVRVEELTDLNGQPAIIMEFVEGLDIKQLQSALKSRQRDFPPKAALQIAALAASALDAAFRRTPLGLDEPLRVVHRDIKPSNIMISVDGEVKVLDFGTARSTSVFRSAQTGAMRFGSWLYMSPERKEGERGDHSSDVYSLGLLTIELLSSDPLTMLSVDPVEHDREVEHYIQRIHDLGMPNESWDLGLREVLRQMVVADPGQRPNAQQVAEVCRQYSEQASGESIETLGNGLITELATRRRQSEEGALTGSRLWVSISGSTPRDSGSPFGVTSDPPKARLVMSPAPETPPREAAPSQPPSQPQRAPAPPAPRPAPTPDPRTAHAMPQPSPYSAQKPVQPGPIAPYDFSVVGRSPFAAQPAPQPAPAAARPAPVSPPSPAPPPAAVAPPPRPAPHAARPQPSPFVAQAGPAQSYASPLPRPVPAPRPLTEARTVRMSPEMVFDPRRNPPPSDAPRPAGAAPVHAEPGSRMWLLWAFLGLGLVVSIVAAFAVTVLVVIPKLRQPRVEVPSSPVEGVPATSSGTPSLAAVTMVPVRVASEGDLLQWIQVEDLEHKVVLAKAPGAIQGNLAPGRYRVMAKVAARPVVSAEIPVADKPLDLSCRPADKGHVRCTGAGLDGEALLVP